MTLKLIQSLSDDIIEWTRDPKNRRLLFVEPREQFLNNPLHMNLGFVGSQLQWMATWHSNEGASRVLAGDATGWQAIHLALHYQFESIRLLVAAFDQNPRRYKSSGVLPNRATLVLAHALAVDDIPIATWLGRKISQRKSDGTFGKWRKSPLDLFIHFLFCFSMEGENIALVPLEKFEIYKDVVAAMLNGSEISNSLISTLCDYHLENAGVGKLDKTSEFTTAPYTLFSCEIISLLRILKSKGLSIEASNHPLLATPLAIRPPSFPDQTDDVLEESIRRFPRIES